jgi:hypothetical protein
MRQETGFTPHITQHTGFERCVWLESALASFEMQLHSGRTTVCIRHDHAIAKYIAAIEKNLPHDCGRIKRLNACKSERFQG